VTDADVVLGRIDPPSFAGGRVALQPALAQAAMARVVSSGALGLGDEDIGYAIDELVDEAMSNAARVHAVESGKTLAERTLIAFGGAAPLHAGRVAEKLGIDSVIIPPDAGVGSAKGFLLAPISYEVARSLYVRLQRFCAGQVNALLSAMAAEARALVARGAQGRPLIERRSAFARYVGQGYEIPIVLPADTLQDSDATTMRKAFEHSYLQQYGRLIEGVDIEVLAWAVTVGTEPAGTQAVPRVPQQPAKPPSISRNVFDIGSGTWVTAAVYARGVLPAGAELAGPAVIVEESTSTVIGPHWMAAIAADGSIVMSPRSIP
jgi:N-methylhydantoinase A